MWISVVENLELRPKPVRNNNNYVMKTYIVHSDGNFIRAKPVRMYATDTYDGQTDADKSDKRARNGYIWPANVRVRISK